MLATSKLVRMLGTFQQGDWKGLKRLIASPWFIGGADQVRLLAFLDLLQAAHPDYERLEDSQLSTAVFGEGEIPKGRLAKLSSKLVRAIEQYVLQSSLIMDDQERYTILAAAWRKRGVDHLAQQYLQKAAQSFANRTDREQPFYSSGMELAGEQGNQIAAQSPGKRALYLKEEEQYLDQRYLLSKLEKTVWLLAQRIQVRTPMEGPLVSIDHLSTIIEELGDAEYPVHCLYRSAWHFLKAYPQADLSAFQALESALLRNGDLIAAEKRKALQTLLRIFATARYNQGEEVYLSFAYNLYKKDLEAGDLYFDGKIHPQTLLNIVTLGCRSEDYKWVKDLLIGHEQLIWDEGSARQVIRFNRALLSFYEGELENALDYIDDSYENIYYRLAARRLEVMIYYEQSSVLLEPKLEAFKVYIYRLSQRQIPAKPKELNNNFIDLLRQILHPSTLNNQKRIDRLREKILTSVHLAERQWLLRQVDQLN